MTAQSNAEPQTLRDAAENLLIAIGMGWDLDGCVENLRAALAQSDAEPEYHPDGRRKGRSRLAHGSKPMTRSSGNAFVDLGFKLLEEPQENRLHRARRFVQAVLSDLQNKITGDQHIHMLNLVIDDIQAALVPTNAAPPRPDASAGLIEAEGLLDARANEFTGYNEKIEQGYRMAAKYLRSRAADRSGK